MYSKIGGLQLSGELVDMNMGREGCDGQGVCRTLRASAKEASCTVLSSGLSSCLALGLHLPHHLCTDKSSKTAVPFYIVRMGLKKVPEKLQLCLCGCGV